MQFEHFRHPDTSFYIPSTCQEDHLSLAIKSNVHDHFMSLQNAAKLQQQIIQNVYNQSRGKIRIQEQDETKLSVLMRDIYDRYHTNDVSFLNNKVVEMSSNIIIGNVLEYVRYRNKTTNSVSLNSDDWQNIINHPVRPDSLSNELFYQIR